MSTYVVGWCNGERVNKPIIKEYLQFINGKYENIFNLLTLSLLKDVNLRFLRHSICGGWTYIYVRENFLAVLC